MTKMQDATVAEPATLTVPAVSPSARTAELEHRFARTVGARYAVSVAGSLEGLQLSLTAAGIGPGHDVVVPSLSSVAPAGAVRHVGARPVFADVGMADANITVETVAAVVTGTTRAVVVVHQAGVPADVDRLREWCAARDLVLVEDGAWALGSTYAGRPVGAGARIAVWSVDSRPPGTIGGSAMVTTDDAAWAGRLRRVPEYVLDAGAADRGLDQLGRLPELLAHRREIGRRYRRAFRSVPGIRPLAEPEWGESNGHAFWVELTASYPLTRDELLRELADAGVPVRRGMAEDSLPPAHERHLHGRLTHARWLAANTLALPVAPDLTADQQEHVIATVRLPSVVGRR